MISASEEEWLTADCFLHNQLMGHHVDGPIKTSMPPDVLLLSLNSPAKDASQNKANLQSFGSSPAYEVITSSFV